MVRVVLPSARARHRMHVPIRDDLCSDFRVLDRWRIPVTVDRAEFLRFVRVFATSGFAPESRIARALFRIRFAVGRWLGWDGGPPQPIPGCRETTVRERLTAAERARDQSISQSLPLPHHDVRPVYLFDDEALIEIANKTIHALVHLEWRDRGVDMTVLVKSRAWYSGVYLAAIWPFRHAIVYPAMFRSVAHAWSRSDPRAAS
jgi:hypothetical protein